jgi:hypothetical protein
MNYRLNLKGHTPGQYDISGFESLSCDLHCFQVSIFHGTFGSLAAARVASPFHTGKHTALLVCLGLHLNWQPLYKSRQCSAGNWEVRHIPLSVHDPTAKFSDHTISVFYPTISVLYPTISLFYDFYPTTTLLVITLRRRCLAWLYESWAINMCWICRVQMTHFFFL